jgi:hypothetical protein
MSWLTTTVQGMGTGDLVAFAALVVACSSLLLAWKVRAYQRRLAATQIRMDLLMMLDQESARHDHVAAILDDMISKVRADTPFGKRVRSSYLPEKLKEILAIPEGLAEAKKVRESMRSTLEQARASDPIELEEWRGKVRHHLLKSASLLSNAESIYETFMFVYKRFAENETRVRSH